ncbi:hypothetical protein [Dictyobacter aurantiacus]|uniref:DUF4177 domain-containing protein n=1 Tax=Dictyobacter aurantiacus TaxID=1936993 RepID=A0A401ZIL2_9CHLR|nr:hypothetical protein [Dictyobacter aurantiacus]GCE06685.1 hypothetical protein KDAU_40140 [Dictyobacter aurantiacus]
MFFSPQPFAPRLADHEVRSYLPIPTIYDSAPARQAQWEYHLLTINTREDALADAEQLNELGKDGWILVNILDERTSGKGSHVYYYFVRQNLNA